ncbi:YggS family pyridoxal phosphate-dependent enzyme [Streptococcus didelphis]|uniref:Pyridoxal phosphate homeostasis protein n=1 Tax=Streptococcus didelphis TaxID=102886 RepID=A0ABY9LIY4_9STRE|nr:YggS family pyridoxal phosphate-dependent enzyme [Streptococcus didelphis]WMB28832.1 YggS family pyridoxal phosphate-dependent enzyme [Streptococcus didelphis]WMB30164.1 YggS family pyridoxal phosphate-dependent enzyme [Streptococcus didelphis]
MFKSIEEAAKEAGRKQEDVTVIAVTKYVDNTIAKGLVDLGIKHIGESRVDKFLDKYAILNNEALTWHLIGSLQRRKVKDVINYVDYFHALDSIHLAKEIEKRANHPIKCFLQVNISGEDSKHGFTVSEIDQAIEEISKLNKVQLVGLMTMAPLDADQKTIAEIFEEARQLRNKLQAENRKNMPFTELSMGMSNDFTIAIQHGASFVRIGTSFFK